jgi:hypothetical protein
MMYNPYFKEQYEDKHQEEIGPDPVVLGHELGHLYNRDRGLLLENEWDRQYGNIIPGFPEEAWNTVFIENKIRNELGLPLRRSYSGVELETPNYVIQNDLEHY